MIIGFTGTRNGMTQEQRREVLWRLACLKEQHGTALGALHGDCVGADADFNRICVGLSIYRSCRPCTFDGVRANTDAREIAAPERPMARNRAIVADADLMIACPPNEEPIKSGSGTWATIGFADRANKPLVIVYPSGRVESRRLTAEATV